MLDVDSLNAIGRKIRRVLKTAKEPMSCEEIAKKLGISKYDIFAALAISLSGWVEMIDSKFRLL